MIGSCSFHLIFRERTSLFASVLPRQLGYPAMKPEQLDVTTAFIEGRYVFILTTGFGKSLCFTCIGVGTGGAEGAIAPPATIKGGGGGGGVRTYRSAPPLLARINFIHNPKYRCVWCQLRSNIRKHNQLTCTTLQ